MGARHLQQQAKQLNHSLFIAAIVTGIILSWEILNHGTISHLPCDSKTPPVYNIRTNAHPVSVSTSSAGPDSLAQEPSRLAFASRPLPSISHDAPVLAAGDWVGTVQRRHVGEVDGVPLPVPHCLVCTNLLAAAILLVNQCMGAIVAAWRPCSAHGVLLTCRHAPAFA
jgi:hypothetical protein